jgi:multidrug efflux pump subunit AcrA (membrane-fusion protein)
MSNEIPSKATLGAGTSYRTRRLVQKWPVLIWLAMLGLVAVLGMQLNRPSRINGMVSASSEEIAPPENGVVLTVHVKEGDAVTVGQALVTLDSVLVQREIDDYKQISLFSGLTYSASSRPPGLVSMPISKRRRQKRQLHNQGSRRHSGKKKLSRRRLINN